MILSITLSLLFAMYIKIFITRSSVSGFVYSRRDGGRRERFHKLNWIVTLVSVGFEGPGTYGDSSSGFIVAPVVIIAG